MDADDRADADDNAAGAHDGADAAPAVAPPPGAEHAPPPAGDEPPEAEQRDKLRWLHRLEESVPVLALALMVLLPLGEIVARRFGTGIPGAAPFTQHLTL